MRAVTKVVVRLFVQAERERRGQQEHAVWMQYARHLAQQRLRSRRVLERLHAEHGVEFAVREWQALAVVKHVRAARACCARGLPKGSLVLDSQILRHVRLEDLQIRLVTATDVQEPS